MTDSLKIAELPLGAKLVRDYLRNDPSLRELYTAPLDAETLLNQAKVKSKSFAHREVLHRVLTQQHKELALSEKQKRNLEQLRNPNCCTITTGHQLNLFTGPIYSIIKILEVVKACEHFNAREDGFSVSPIFWMASEDHDFEEINHFWYGNYKFEWEQKSGNAVGRLRTEGLTEKGEVFWEVLGYKPFKDELRQHFQAAYEKKNLAQASRWLIHQLLGEYGILILDGDDPQLKELMQPHWKKELEEKTTFREVQKTNGLLGSNGYKIQVNPREINLFWLDKNQRKRIVEKEGKLAALGDKLPFDAQNIWETHPEKISPNALLRPLYQEVVLPNIAYVGGMGEIAYWLQLRSTFQAFGVPFPLLGVRNSMAFQQPKSRAAQEKLGIADAQWFLAEHELLHQKITEFSDLGIPFQDYQKQLITMFSELHGFAQATDATFGNMVRAQETKQLKGLEAMRKRMIKAEGKKMAGKVERIKALRNELYPNGKLQERHYNFATYYAEYGSRFFDWIYKTITPLQAEFHFVSLDDFASQKES